MGNEIKKTSSTPTPSAGAVTTDSPTSAATTGSAEIPDAFEIAEQLATASANAVYLPTKNPYPDNKPSPVAAVSSKMVEGTYGRADVVADVKALTGIDLDLSSAQGKKILFVVPQHGYWSSELTLPAEVLKAAGYEIEYMTPEGKAPFVLDVSIGDGFRDQAWGALQVSQGEATLGQRYNNPTTAEGKPLATPLSLNETLDSRPTPKDGPGARESYATALNAQLQNLAKKDYSGVVIVGGSGAIVDLAYDNRLETLLNFFDDQQKPIAGICYGVLAMLQSTKPGTEQSLVHNRVVTGHSEADDYTEGTGYKTGPGPNDWSIGTQTAMVNLELMSKKNTGPSGGFISIEGTPMSAVIDGHHITARTTPDGYPAALLMLARLHGKQPLPARFMITDNTMGREPTAKDIERPKLVQENYV